ncbi:site-specific DNA recombinase [Peribacillus sp. B2I2]|uniref:recombinase family protein n=1 Tax=Peribacillus sp. B2I2 TaxID=3156468 RepID=UPI003510E174
MEAVATVASKIKHVAIYLRISQEKKGENVETLGNHRSILTDYATSQGWTYVLYEEVLSGGKTDINERPQLQRLLTDIEKFDGIMVMELSRLSRNGLISETVLQQCVDYDTPIVTREKIYDLANVQNDVLTYRFGSLIASQEHSLIGKRSKNNKIAMTKQGLYVSGNTPFGYKRNNATKKLEIDEQSAQIIRYIFKLHGEGLGSYKIRDILNAEGYKSATGKPFNIPSIRRIIRNPVYKGTVVFNDRKRIKVNGKYTYKNIDTIEVEKAHPAIIAVEEWNRVNDVRIARAEYAQQTREKPATKTGVTALKDLMYCANCGRKLAVRKDNKSGKHHIKVCEYLMPNGVKCGNAGIRVQYVEELVMQRVTTVRTEIEQEIERLLNTDTSDITKDIVEQLSRVDKQITEQEKAFSTLIDLAVQGILTAEEIAGKKKEITARLDSLKAEKADLTVKLQNTNTATVTDKLQNMLTVIDQLEGVGADPTALNTHLKRFIRKIYYDRMLPEELAHVSTNNPVRRNYPFTIEIEYM